MSRRQLRIVHDSDRAPARPPPLRVPAAYVTDSLFRSPGLEAILDRGLRAIVALTGARGGAMRLASGDGRGMRLVSAIGMSPETAAQERVVPLDCGICGQALRQDGALYEEAPAVCARRLEGPVLAFPLHCEGRPVGVFNLFFGEPARVPADLAPLLEPTAQMLDLVLDNAFREHERLQASAASERQMCGSEVHDSLAQGLAYMRMRMPLLQDAIRGGERSHALKYFQDVNDALGEAHARLRELIAGFRSAVEDGLVAALENVVRTFEERTGVRLVLENRAPGLRLAAEQELQAFHIVQEALANVIKHAGARSARIVIDRTARQARISVEDDGCGLKGRRRGGDHYGIDIMRERAQRIGGTLELRSTPGGGTRVRLALPLPRAPER